MLCATLCACLPALAQNPAQDSAQNQTPGPLVETGQVVQDGHRANYLIRRLPVSSFPDLPDQFASLLNRRGCLIPQTYEAHHPENVIHARLERASSTDWAALCSVRGTVSLLVYFASAPDQVAVLASGPETERLQAHDSSGVLGFNWGIDPASPESIREAQVGMEHRPSPVDHDALVDSVVDRHDVYHFYRKNAWTVLDMP